MYLKHLAMPLIYEVFTILLQVFQLTWSEVTGVENFTVAVQLVTLVGNLR